VEAVAEGEHGEQAVELAYVTASHPPRSAGGTRGPVDPTARGVEAWPLIATGLDNTEIAQSMETSASTVKNCITGIFGKLRVRDRAQVVIAAHETGLVSAVSAE
jgi:DNA-binding NarL/FixJ family response regulator